MSMPKFDKICTYFLKAETNNEYLKNLKYVCNKNGPYLLLTTEKN